MGTIWIREFTGGLDARRLPETTPGGVLIKGIDGHINRGGEFEQRARFVKAFTLPPGTKGLAATVEGLVVFGSEVAPSGLPASVTYQQIAGASAAGIADVLSWDLFAGKIAVAAKYADGTVCDFYDGARISTWPAGAPFATFLKTIQRKVYGAAGPNLVFSAVSDPMNFEGGVGAGFIDMSTQATGAEVLTAIAQYQNYIAVFAGRTIQLEYVDPDPALNRLVQVLNNTGAIARRSVTQFGDNDVFYLDESGIRSLRARESINVAFSSDTGNPIDDLVIARLEAMTEEQRARAISIIEPRYGRLWMALGDLIFVFSYFTGSKVSAWTTYQPGFNVDDMVVFNRRVYLRSGDDVYVYGGLGEALDYTGVEAEAWLPYLDAGKPTQKKAWQGVDAALRGTWEISAGMSPTNEAASDKLAAVAATTFEGLRVGAIGESTHISLRFRCVQPPAAGPAKLSSAVVHHNLNDNED